MENTIPIRHQVIKVGDYEVWLDCTSEGCEKARWIVSRDGETALMYDFRESAIVAAQRLAGEI